MENETMSVEPTVTARSLEDHLSPEEVSAHVDGSLTGPLRDAVFAHLARCAECRTELVDVSRILQTRPQRSRVRKQIWIPAAAAAALLLLVQPRSVREPEVGQHREGAVTGTLAPRPVAPLGRVASAGTLVWSSVFQADGYRVRLFDADSRVLWETVVPDTVVAVPTSALLAPGATYYWRVEARTGFDRWVASDLAEFSLRRSRP